MKLTKAYLGKMVEIVWRDPGTGHTKTRLADRSDAARGMAAMATWRERGVIDDLTDGIVRIVHSEGEDPVYIVEDRDLELSCTWVHEALIERIVVYEPVARTAEEVAV